MVIHLQGKFDEAVEILKPLRYKVDLLGGSRAQVRKSCPPSSCSGCMGNPRIICNSFLIERVCVVLERAAFLADVSITHGEGTTKVWLA